MRGGGEGQNCQNFVHVVVECPLRDLCLKDQFFHLVCKSLKKGSKVHLFSLYITIFWIFRPVLVLLLLSMVNEKQPFELRCAILYCLQSYLHKNPTRQKEVMRTLLPQQESVASAGGKVIKLMGIGYSLYAFAHYLVHSLFGLNPNRTKKRGLEPKNCPKMIFF